MWNKNQVASYVSVVKIIVEKKIVKRNVYKKDDIDQQKKNCENHVYHDQWSCKSRVYRVFLQSRHNKEACKNNTEDKNNICKSKKKSHNIVVINYLLRCV